MSAAVFGGLLGGLLTIGLSEVLVRLWGSRPPQTFWKLSLLGVVLRAAWVLGLLLLVLSTGWLEPAPFTVALLTSYLIAQVLEGIRYQRFIRSQ